MKPNNLSEHKTLRKIISFRDLEKGWNNGEGGPPTESAVKKAVMIVEQAMMSMLDTGAFPGTDGEIMVTVYHKEHYQEFIIETDDTVTFVHEINDEEVFYEENLSFKKALNKFNEFCEKIWNTSESYPSNTLTIDKTVLIVKNWKEHGFECKRV